MKKMIKLINSERTNAKVDSAKACVSTSYDVCTIIDVTSCTQYSYDRCGKDYKSCYNESYDYCVNIDNDACSGTIEDYN